MTKTFMNYSVCTSRAQGIVLKQHQQDENLLANYKNERPKYFFVSGALF